MSSPIVFLHSVKSIGSDHDRLADAYRKLLKRDDLGFFRWPQYRDEYEKLSEIATILQKQQTRLVVIGLGGSQSGGQCLVESIQGPNHNVEFWGEIDPLFLESKLASPLLEDSTFLIISKSGNTLEVAALMNVIGEKLKVNGIDFAERSYVITENREDNSLRQWAVANDVSIIDHPRDVGGRFSVFTPTGILPALFAGVDVEQLRLGAQWVLTQEKLIVDLASYFAGLFQEKKSITVFWSYVYPLSMFQKWLEQLWAESLGQKNDKNGNPASAVSTPLMVQGVMSQHSVLQQFSEGTNDKGFLFFRRAQSTSEGNEAGGAPSHSLLKGFEFLKGKGIGSIFHAESVSVEEALLLNGRPCASLELNRIDAYTIGALLMLFQVVVGTLGEAMNMDVYVQPGVEKGKTLALQKLRN